MGLCCSRATNDPEKSKVSRHITMRPEQPKRRDTDKRLMTLDPQTVTDVPHKGEFIRVRVVKVYDGDTLTFLFLHGGKYPLKFRLRIVNIDAPELKGPGVTENHKRAGIAVRDVVSSVTMNRVLWARIDKWDKYGGRVDGDIYIESNLIDSLATHNVLSFEDITEHGVSLSNWLIRQEIVHSYNAKGARLDWTDEEFRKIEEHCKYLERSIQKCAF